MTQTDIEQALCDAIRQVQEDSGRESPRLSGEIVPIGDLDGFDSINSIEVGAVVSDALGVEVGEHPLVHQETGRAISISEAAGQILRQLNKNSGAAEK